MIWVMIMTIIMIMIMIIYYYKKNLKKDGRLRYCRKLTYANNALCSLSLGDNGVSVFPL